MKERHESQAETKEGEQMTTHTYSEIAANWNLWAEYVDTGGTMTEEEFEERDEAEKIAIIVACFGAEEDAETVED